jgi:diguanylate cyclase (GGDEF)-like protein
MEDREIQPVARGARTVVVGPIVGAIAAMAASAFTAPGVCWDVASTLSSVAALVGTILARGRAAPGNRARWSLWAAASAAWLAGQIAWDVYGLTGFPQSPNLSDIGWWAFALLAIAGILRIPGASRSARAAAFLETLPLIVAAIALTFAELWNTAADSPLATAPKVSALIYPALYVAAIVVTLQGVVGGPRRGMNTSAVRLVLIGIAVEAIAFTLWSTQLLTRSYVPGATPLDPVWTVGLCGIGVGGLLAAIRPGTETDAAKPTYRGVILLVGVFLTLPLVLVQSRVIHAPLWIRIALEAGLTFCAGALLVRSTVLERRLRALLERERAALANLAEREVELARLNQELVEDSRRDPLTGVRNRRALADDLPALEELHRDDRATFAFALCDVDHFKAYNDRFGHLAGDQALRMIAATARGALRADDAAYRYGGEELLLVLRDVSEGDAVKIAQRVRTAVQRAAFPHPDSETRVLTISIGVAGGQEDAATLLARADAALYEAKRLGRNRVVGGGHDAVVAAARPRAGVSEEPVPRHLRTMLSVSRAAAAGSGRLAVADVLAEAIRNELAYQVVAVNLVDEGREQVTVAVVKGDRDAEATLLGTSNSWSEWQKLLRSGEHVSGAVWVPAGTRDLSANVSVWTAPAVAVLAADGWHPEDMLLLPLRSSTGAILGIVSVDQPVLGRRPTEQDLSSLMAVADHAGLALEQSQRDDDAAGAQAQELRLAAMMLLAEALDLRDPSTARHARMVGRYARETAVALGLEPSHVERVHAAGVLHDLGKLAIADAILHKPGPLTDAEWDEMRRHPEVGAQILEHGGMHDIADWVRAHHERIDGCGYPAGLGGSEISLEARILAVADAYEAMVADRPYRGRMSAELAREDLMRCSGSQFDPVVVRAFLEALDGQITDEEQLERVA